MKYYLAPLEGITGFIFRNTWAECFGGMDKYFTPFVSPNGTKTLMTKEKKDIDPEHNKGLPVVPQILANQSEYFIDAAEKLRDLGYTELNLNLGCPSGTVTSKQKGSGFLAHPEELDQFLYEIYDGFLTKENIKFSIKTRLGMDTEEDFHKVLEIYNKYPLEELIIHPRIRQDFYKAPVRLDFFEEVYKTSKASVCYNGDIFTPKLYHQFTERFPDIDCVMLGRGILLNPGLLQQLKTGKPMTKEQLHRFLNRLVEAYQEDLSGDRPVLYKMKEIWFYLGNIFENHEKYSKKIKKANKLSEFEDAVNAILANEEFAGNVFR